MNHTTFRRGRTLKAPVFTCSDTGEATLRIVGVASEDDGVYTCVATNELGSVTSSASLRVLGESRDHCDCFFTSFPHADMAEQFDRRNTGVRLWWA